MAGTLRTVLLHLGKRLFCHSGIPLCNPVRHLFIPFKPRILNGGKAMLIGIIKGVQNSLIIIHIQHRRFGILNGADCLDPAGLRTFWHKNFCLAAQPGCRPGHSPAMIAIGGRDKNGRFLRVLCQRLMDGISASQPFKGVEPKTIGFILDIHGLYAKPPGQGGKRHQGRGLIHVQRAMVLMRWLAVGRR